MLNRWFSLSPYLVDEGLLVYFRYTLSHAIWGKKKIHFPGSTVTTCHYYLPGQVDPPPDWGREAVCQAPSRTWVVLLVLLISLCFTLLTLLTSAIPVIRNQRHGTERKSPFKLQI